MPRKKINPTKAQDEAAVAKAAALAEPVAYAPEGASVTYLGAAPINFRGHAFMPGEPVSDLPDDVLAMVRNKSAFRVSDGDPE